MKVKNSLRPAIKKLLKIKEVAGVVYPTEETTNFPEKKTGIGEKTYEDKNGKMKRKPVKINLKAEIVLKDEKSAVNKIIKEKIKKIMGEIPYKILYKI